MKIILGSQSSGRKAVAEELGLSFEIMIPGIDEKAIRLDDPKELTLALANAKAEALLPKIKEEALLITSDQVAWHKNRILEKPATAAEARAVLKMFDLENPAETVTSVVVVNTKTGKRWEGVDIARVWFRPLSEEAIEEWIQTGRVYEHAGSFAVQESVFQPFIDRMEGEIESIMGLPKKMTLDFLRQAQNK